LFRKKRRKDEIDLAAENVLKSLKTGVKLAEIEEEEETIEEPELDKQESEEITQEKIALLSPGEVSKLLSPIGRDLEKIENALGKIHPKIESISKLVPRLSPVKELLQHDIAKKKEEMEKNQALLQELEKQEEDLDGELQKKQKTKEKLEKEMRQMENALEKVRKDIPELAAEKEGIEDDLAQREEDLRIVEEHIKRIVNLQKASSTPITEAS
jgi:chromosome segregation ATPase